MSNLVAAIMAGGAGTRFWPLSTQHRPKQFLRLVGNRTLLQESYDRVVGLTGPDRILVVTSESYRGLVREQLPELSHDQIIGEPRRRDTAAAIALATLVAQKHYGDASMAVLTADHWIRPIDRFQEALSSAVRQARLRDAVYTFAIRPTRPATGYGYLKLAPPAGGQEPVAHHQVMEFREKPELATAISYLESGEYCWNSGMFVFTVPRMLEEFARYLPEHLACLKPAMMDFGTERWPVALEQAFESLHSISIDYGVMEKLDNLWAVVAGFDWSDLGGWAALSHFLPAREGNRIHGQVASLEAEHNIVFCEDENEVMALLGVSDLVIVRSQGRTLVARRDSLDKLKELVQECL